MKWPILYNIEVISIETVPISIELYNDRDFLDRFGVSKATANNIITMIGENISHRTNNNRAVSVELLTSLRCYATDTYQRVAGDQWNQGFVRRQDRKTAERSHCIPKTSIHQDARCTRN